MIELQVDLGARAYPIRIGSGLLSDPAVWAPVLSSGSVGVVSNETIAPLYLDTLVGTLQGLGKKVTTIILPDGERYKNWEILNLIFDGLLTARCDRKTTLIALGGGVVGDMTGFAAATYQRGIAFVQAPTTLLAQVDSSVGGKTGINHPLGKNMLGAFHQPNAVIMDLATLSTLPERELSAGLAEIIKHGAMADAAYFDWLEVNMPALRRRDLAALTHAIKRSCEIKADVVRQDERESGLRAMLNFGHTFGHAIEAGLGYGGWLHGEAVGAGMVQAADLSQRLGLLDPADALRLRRLIEAAGLPTVAPAFDFAQWQELMAVDKKADAGALRFILLERLGAARIASVPREALAATLAATATLPVSDATARVDAASAAPPML